MGFARMRRSIPKMLGAALFSAAAVVAFAGCSGKDKKDPTPAGSIDPDLAVLLENFGFTFGFSSRGAAVGDAFVVVSQSGNVTAVVDLTNNIVDVYNTSGSLSAPSLICSVNLNTVKMLSTDAAALFASLDPQGYDGAATRDVYDNPAGGDTIGIGALAIHPSDEFMVIGVNDTNNNGLFDSNPLGPIASITRSPSRVLWVSLNSIAAASAGAVSLPARSAGSPIAVTILHDNGAATVVDAATDGDSNFFNVTGLSFSPNGRTLCALGNLGRTIDMSGDATVVTDGPDGFFDDPADVTADITAAGRYQVGDSTIVFFGADTFGNSSAEGRVPATSRAIRDLTFDGTAGNDLTIANYGYNISNNHLFGSTTGNGEFIAVLGPSGVGTAPNNYLDPELEDARDTSDDHDAGGDNGVAVTGIIIPGTNDQGEIGHVVRATGLDSMLIPSPANFSAGSGVSDGAGLLSNAGDALVTDTLFTFVGEFDGDATSGAVFLTGFGMRGDLQARFAPGGALFGRSVFVTSNAQGVQVVATVPSLDTVSVFPICTVANSDNFLYGELMDGSNFDVNTFVSTPDLTLAGLTGFTRVGRNFFAVTNRTAGATDGTSVGVYRVTAPIQTISSGGGTFRVINPVAVTVDAVTFSNSGNRSGTSVGAASIDTGDSRDFFAIYNATERTFTLIRY